jgi:hypothetical protein
MESVSTSRTPGVEGQATGIAVMKPTSNRTKKTSFCIFDWLKIIQSFLIHLKIVQINSEHNHKNDFRS